MENEAASNVRGRNNFRIGGWSLLGMLLLMPAVVMQFTREMDWDETDFIVFGLMLGSVGLGAEYLMRKSDGVSYRIGAAIALALGFFLVWISLAVGIIGSEDNPLNLLFVSVLAVAISGASVARFEAAGMAWTMTATAAMQALVALVGMSVDPKGLVLSGMFAAGWLLSAYFFRKAARRRS